VTFGDNDAGFQGTEVANFPTAGGTLTFDNVAAMAPARISFAIRYAASATVSPSGSIAVDGGGLEHPVSAHRIFNIQDDPLPR
jgi:hypothetical protein